MFRLPVGCAAVVHVAILGWLANGRDEGHRVVPPPPAAAAVVDKTPIEIAIIADPPVATSQGGVVIVTRGHQRASIARSSRGATSSDVSATPSAEPGPRQARAMRGNDVDLAIPATRWDALDRVPAGTAAQRAPAPSDQTFDHETFAMQVDRDGTAHLHDKRNLHFPDPKHTQAELPDDDPLITTMPSIGVTIAKFDITDFAMRLHGDDPYASAKLKLLDATRNARAEIGAKHTRDQLAHVGALVRENLEQSWKTLPDSASRKRALFELWDECAETGANDLVVAGTSARSTVIRFIRERLPPGSADAFTATELAAFNRNKQAHATFAPYASDPM